MVPLRKVGPGGDYGRVEAGVGRVEREPERQGAAESPGTETACRLQFGRAGQTLRGSHGRRRSGCPCVT